MEEEIVERMFRLTDRKISFLLFAIFNLLIAGCGTSGTKSTGASYAPAEREAAYIVSRHCADFARARNAAEASFGPSDAWTPAQRDKYIYLLCEMIRKFHSSDFPEEPWTRQVQDDCMYILSKTSCDQ